MRSSHQSFHDEIRPLHLLDEQPTPPQCERPDQAFLGAVLTALAVVVPVLALLAL